MMTRQEYAVALVARAKLMRESKTDTAIVITRWDGATERPEWTAWVKYWNAIGAKATIEFIEGRGTWTVPNLYPWEFDIGYAG